ncbi:transmembrane protein, putative (macronuclear) [Tetrahymena thermophila SB210]|uniref:Transmembrane protein, putative n=1 Tax=Tetrahymena thermophila (strain SB210) TaxID=312017 RepID=W7X1Q7_TETTS|nr:transmembrane protein, putative [Tetrahymena thermophila SB210]EWS73180.1 transmembrane protein, putative [Tetrahymena thermophila SB210]|eukprot:XP_012654285.1 transmembrane protein, putative [Tetrahymena thermophila SB210]
MNIYYQLIIKKVKLFISKLSFFTNLRIKQIRQYNILEVFIKRKIQQTFIIILGVMSHIIFVRFRQHSL